MKHLERKVSCWVLIRQIGAAVLMCVVIWLFKS